MKRMVAACAGLPGLGSTFSEEVRQDFIMLVEARLRVVADCTNQQLAEAASEEAVVDWPPLHHADVCGWARAVQAVIEGPEELLDMWGNISTQTAAVKANTVITTRKKAEAETYLAARQDEERRLRVREEEEDEGVDLDEMSELLDTASMLGGGEDAELEGEADDVDEDRLNAKEETPAQMKKRLREAKAKERQEQKLAALQKKMLKNAKSELAEKQGFGICKPREDTSFWDENLPKLKSEFVEVLSQYRKLLLEEVCKAVLQAHVMTPPLPMPSPNLCPIDEAALEQSLHTTAALVGIRRISRQYIINNLVPHIAELAKGCQLAWVARVKHAMVKSWTEEVLAHPGVEPALQMASLVRLSSVSARKVVSAAPSSLAVEALEDALTSLLAMSCTPMVESEMILESAEDLKEPTSIFGTIFGTTLSIEEKTRHKEEIAQYSEKLFREVAKELSTNFLMQYKDLLSVRAPLDHAPDTISHAVLWTLAFQNVVPRPRLVLLPDLPSLDMIKVMVITEAVEHTYVEELVLRIQEKAFPGFNAVQHELPHAPRIPCCPGAKDEETDGVAMSELHFGEDMVSEALKEEPFQPVELYDKLAEALAQEPHGGAERPGDPCQKTALPNVHEFVGTVLDHAIKATLLTVDELCKDPETLETKIENNSAQFDGAMVPWTGNGYGPGNDYGGCLERAPKAAMEGSGFVLDIAGFTCGGRYEQDEDSEAKLGTSPDTECTEPSTAVIRTVEVLNAPLRRN